MMEYKLSKIIYYQKSLHRELNMDKYYFNLSDSIVIGRDLYIAGLYLTEKDRGYAFAYIPHQDIEIPIKLSVLSNSTLGIILAAIEKGQ